MKSSNFQVIGLGRRTRLVDDKGWEYAERLHITGIVCMVAVTQSGRIVLTQQYRRPVNREVIELPAGLVGDKEGLEKESLEEAARRELEEETGYQCKQLRFLTAGPPSAGVTNEIITLYQAQGLAKIGPGGGDDEEKITVHEVPLTEVHDWLANITRQGNILVDPKVYTGLYYVGRMEGGI